MGLREQIAASVTGAFKSLDNLRTPVTYKAITIGAYDPTTDTHTKTTVTTTVADAVLVSYSEAESAYFRPDKIGQKILIPASALATDPKNDDIVTIDGVDWMVVRVKGVPGNSLWIIFIQAA